MRIPVDPHSRTPLYQQIETFLRQAILSGSIAPETRLPASRQLARDLGVNRITVETAYDELEAGGLVYSRMGSGTYVAQPGPVPPLLPEDQDAPWPLWQQEVLDRALERGLRPVDEPAPVIPAAEAAVAAAAVIDFSGGTGDPHLFPTDSFRKVIQDVLHRDGTAALEYGPPGGYPPLRETIAHILASQGLPTRPENLLITSGSQQAIALVAQVLLAPGDRVLVEAPTYSMALDLFRGLGVKIIGIPTDEQGMSVESLEPLLQRHHPRLIYTIPNFQNPTGACLGSSRRRQLVSLAGRYNVPVLEDDYVGDLRYEGRVQPALKALDPGGRVIYISTFSKMLMPGLRVGFLAADGPVYERLVHAKRTSDLATSNLFQRALEAYVTVGRYQAHLRRSCQIYRKRRDAMLQAIHRYLPAGVWAATPQGGLFIWLRLPGSLTARQLLAPALLAGVRFAPGDSFFVDSGGESWIRLNFAAQPPAQIEAGIARLGKVIK